MLEYLPWATTTLNTALEKYSKRTFSILDVELGGGCNYHCLYCDSPDRKKKCLIPLEAFERLMNTRTFDWVFICGLGEPTFQENYTILIGILKLCRKYGVKCSIFSNLSGLTPELIDYIELDTLYVLFKYDSPNTKTVNALYGIKTAKEQLSMIEDVAKHVHLNDGKTNLAASIVPTRLNYDDVIEVVKKCINLNIFPLLAELESSGNGELNYENLRLTPDELDMIKQNIEDLLGYEYHIPLCPSVINGIHFNSDSYITVDDFSGLSCHWFWLEEPRTRRLLKFDEKSSLNNITETIINYRNTKLMTIKEYLEHGKNVGASFGGCGGKIESIFRKYIKYHKGE